MKYTVLHLFMIGLSLPTGTSLQSHFEHRLHFIKSTFDISHPGYSHLKELTSKFLELPYLLGIIQNMLSLLQTLLKMNIQCKHTFTVTVNYLFLCSNFLFLIYSTHIAFITFWYLFCSSCDLPSAYHSRW